MAVNLTQTAWRIIKLTAPSPIGFAMSVKLDKGKPLEVPAMKYGPTMEAKLSRFVC